MAADRGFLIARRVPRAEVVLGRAYVIHARNGGIGVAVQDDGLLGYRLHRDKMGRHYLFVEIDWEDHPNFGTAIPLRLLPDAPPIDDGLCPKIPQKLVIVGQPDPFSVSAGFSVNLR